MGGQRAGLGHGGSERRELFAGAGEALKRLAAALPRLRGEPVRVEWGRGLRAHKSRLEAGPGPGQPVHAASYPRQRRLVLDSALRRQPAERARIFVHEVFHFVWVRLGNPSRRAWEALLEAEIAAGVPGELGWSAEWRKDALRPGDRRNRTRRWREYACESFCDTAAWLWAGLERHEEFTLPRKERSARRRWWMDLRRHHPEGWRI